MHGQRPRQRTAPRGRERGSCAGPTIPSGRRPLLRWNFRKDRSVACRKTTVNLAGSQAETAEPELERRHIPPDEANPQLALSEQRPAERAERPPRGGADVTGRCEACCGAGTYARPVRVRGPLRRRSRPGRDGVRAARPGAPLPARSPSARAAIAGVRPGQGARTDGTDHRCPAHSIAPSTVSGEFLPWI